MVLSSYLLLIPGKVSLRKKLGQIPKIKNIMQIRTTGSIKNLSAMSTTIGAIKHPTVLNA
jgi:hypothetical protein